MFHKKHIPHMLAHTPRLIDTYHAHKHAHLYIYSHCDRKGHFDEFYFDKVNISYKNIWAHESINPQGPKKVSVPQFIPNLFNIDVSYSKM